MSLMIVLDHSNPCRQVQVHRALRPPRDPQLADSRSRLLLLDPHGLVYLNVVPWLAKHGLDRPVIPIDLHRDDLTLPFNLFRRSKERSAGCRGELRPGVGPRMGRRANGSDAIFTLCADVILLAL